MSVVVPGRAVNGVEIRTFCGKSRGESQECSSEHLERGEVLQILLEGSNDEEYIWRLLIGFSPGFEGVLRVDVVDCRRLPRSLFFSSRSYFVVSISVLPLLCWSWN